MVKKDVHSKTTTILFLFDTLENYIVYLQDQYQCMANKIIECNLVLQDIRKKYLNIHPYYISSTKSLQAHINSCQVKYSEHFVIISSLLDWVECTFNPLQNSHSMFNIEIPVVLTKPNRFSIRNRFFKTFRFPVFRKKFKAYRLFEFQILIKDCFST